MAEDDISALRAEMDELSSSSQGLASELKGLFSELANVTGATSELGKTYKNDISKAMSALITDGQSLGNVMKNLALSMADKALSSATNPVIDNASGILSSVVSNILPFANGGVVSGGVQAFADGGVVSGPVNFPMRGKTGLMGEAGPEAIMPLKRGADGKLGIATAGGGNTTQVNVTISTPDLKSFQSSKNQVANQLKQAINNANQTR